MVAMIDWEKNLNFNNSAAWLAFSFVQPRSVHLCLILAPTIIQWVYRIVSYKPSSQLSVSESGDHNYFLASHTKPISSRNSTRSFLLHWYCWLRTQSPSDGSLAYRNGTSVDPYSSLYEQIRRYICSQLCYLALNTNPIDSRRKTRLFDTYLFECSFLVCAHIVQVEDLCHTFVEPVCCPVGLCILEAIQTLIPI